MGRLLAVGLLLLSIATCQSQPQPKASPLPTPTPHTAPADAILQTADVPTGLSLCQGSGPIDVYLSVLGGVDASLASRVSSQWQQLRSEGAIAAAINTFTSDSGACSAELGATTTAKGMTSFVAEFADEGEADRAWQSGVFGFTPPPLGQVSPGLARGTSTGLGLSSFTYERPSVRLACWRHSVFVALVVVSNLDVNTFHAATGAIDPRLN